MGGRVLCLTHGNSDRIPFARRANQSETEHAQAQGQEQFTGEERGALIQQNGEHDGVSLKFRLDLELKTLE